MFFHVFSIVFGCFGWFFHDFLMPNERPRNTLVFSIFIAFATLVMMNLVTGVFVDGAQRIAREEKNQDASSRATEKGVNHRKSIEIP